MGAVATENTNIDVLAGNVAEDYTSNDDLLEVRTRFQLNQNGHEKHTVGMARP